MTRQVQRLHCSRGGTMLTSTVRLSTDEARQTWFNGCFQPVSAVCYVQRGLQYLAPRGAGTAWTGWRCPGRDWSRLHGRHHSVGCDAANHPHHTRPTLSTHPNLRTKHKATHDEPTQSFRVKRQNHSQTLLGPAALAAFNSVRWLNRLLLRGRLPGRAAGRRHRMTTTVRKSASSPVEAGEQKKPVED